MRTKHPWLLAAILASGLPAGALAQNSTGYTNPSFYGLFPEQPLANGVALPTEQADLSAALQQYKTAHDPLQTQAIEAFLTAHPHSAWANSLWLNLGLIYQQSGRYSDAAESYEHASQGISVLKNHDISILSDRIYAAQLSLHTQLGHQQQVELLLKQTAAHQSGIADAVIAQAKQGLWEMQNNPQESFRCGSVALAELLQQSGISGSQQLLSLPAPKEGFSLAELQTLADKHQFQSSVIRTNTQIPVPSVVHWKSGHFATVLAKNGDHYTIADPISGQNTDMTSASILRESSGHYLVNKALSGSGEPVALSTANAIRGAGYTGSSDNTATSDSDTKNCNDSCPGSGSSKGMPHYAVTSMLVSLNITDTPIGYDASLGPDVNFTLTYNQLEATQPATFTFSNLGQKWSHNWMGWVQDNPNSLGNSVKVMLTSGGARTERGYNSSNGEFTAESTDGTKLVLVSTNPIKYERRSADGSKEVYAQSDNSTSSTRRIFLTSRIDAQGNEVTLTYDDTQRLTTITDALGQKTTLEYGDSDHPLMITGVTDPFGRHATIEYDENQRLNALTDSIGMRSSFSYNNGTFINAMTTPYGSTSFVTGQNGVQRWLEATDPQGNKERVEFNHGAAGIPFNESTTPAGMNLFNSYINGRNTYYWDKTAMKEGAGDYTKALIHHWLHDTHNTSVTAPVLESIKYPLENRIWFNYPDQGWGGATGALDKPSIIGRVRDDGSTQLTKISYNSIGKVTQYTDPAGRVTTMTYADNQQDLTAVAQGGKQIAAYTWNEQHLPLTFTNAAGQTTTMTYNDNGQLTSVTNPLKETTRYTYDESGHLLRVINPKGKVATQYTYDDVGRVATSTDALGYTVSYEYDKLDRLTKTAYPDGTARAYVWDKLNVSSVQDRLGRTTQYSYDDLGRLVSQTDPMGRAVQYGYYENGRLKTLTDAMGRTTSWTRDIEGRVTRKSLPDGAATYFDYDSSSRLVSQTDPLGQVKNLSYTADDKVAAISYSNAQNATSAVSFSYDSSFPLLTSMTDGTGKTTYTYGDIGAVGALQRVKETPAGKQQPVTYRYDAVGRVLNRTTGDNTDAWQYDNLGRVAQLTNALGVFNYAYLGDTTQVRSEALQQSPWRTDYVYAGNQLDRQLLAITHPLKLIGAKSVFTFHDEEGHLLMRHDWPLGQHDHYEYDNADRLTSVMQGKWLGERGHEDHGFWTKPAFGKTSFDYDDADNILSITKGRKQTTFTANDANQVASENNQSYSYDANGNLLDDGRFTYSWDAENRLLSATNKTSGAISAFTYDGLSRRISNTETVKGRAGNSKSTTTYYQWCGDTLCMALDSSGAVTERYYPQGEQINGKNRYYATDKLGSVMQVVNANGSLLGESRYDAYGKRELAMGIQPRFGYAGMFRHEPTGLNLTLYRAYNPQTGRWLSRDPIGENGGLNIYGYVGNDPLGAVDPEGLNGHDISETPYERSQDWLHEQEHDLASPLVDTDIDNDGKQDIINPFVLNGGAAAKLGSSVCSSGSLPMGNKRNQFNQPKNPAYQPIRNQSANVNGLDYSGHALDRMQDRGLTPTVISNTIENGNSTPSRGGTTLYYDSTNNISVVINSQGKVVTVKYGK
jgi:RHS repeat-associated protein